MSTARIALLAVLGLTAAALAAPAHAQTRLFSDDAPIAVTIEGPIGDIVRAAARSTDAHPATIAADGVAQPLAIELSARGISRRREEVCSFPPLRIAFARGVARGTVFAGQERLKLVTHCRPLPRYEQFAVLEYLAYRMYNVLTPASFRVRPLDVTYDDSESERAPPRHFGFFIEDVDDVARRNRRVELEVETRGLAVDQYDPKATTTLALFQYMIGNLDWDYRSGPVGEDCCHNVRLIARQGATSDVVPVPYDFDFSGFVSAPYAVPPEQVNISNVRTRFFRGRCRHNDLLAETAEEFRAKRAEINALIAGEARLNNASRGRAQRYVDDFFAILDDPDRIEQRLVQRCIR